MTRNLSLGIHSGGPLKCRVFGKIREIHEKHDVSIVLAEQNATKTLAVADRVMLLSLGSIYRIDDTANIDSDALKEGYRI